MTAPSLQSLAGDIYYIIVPVVVVVVILKLCLIFWRVWVYQKVRSVCDGVCALSAKRHFPLLNMTFTD